eukprot:XP_788094.3 PREDICTED: uncharacterized protein C2orf42 [Strongylocentrotus purpuratus]
MMNSALKVSTTPDPKALFKDLGRPTLRGVRKCPNCGIYNGIRGLSCKNKDCNMVLRGKGRKGNQSADAIRIITGSSAMVYSVRLRDRGPDYRGFVELPLSEEIILQGPDAETMTLVDVPHCYIGSCQKSLATEGNQTTCPHIELAQKCATEAQPLTLKNSVLNSLPVSNEMKQAIWLLATETTGPLVQRVSKNIMVVKCKAQQTPQLGFLHFSFSESPKKKGSVEHRFHCSCRQFKNFKHSTEDSKKKCVHFYACICAFASEDALTKEFKYFINMDEAKDDVPDPSQGSVQITIIDGQLTTTSPETVSMAITMPGLQSKKRRKDDTLAQASSALLTLQEGATSPAKKTAPSRRSGGPAPDPDQSFNKGVPQPLVEALVEGPTVSFNHWLGSVTERINQTMHYQFEGTPEPLVFHIPQVFFDILQQRISSGSRKKRLPNSTVAFIRKDALPLGTFTKYTWQLTSIIQVKQIFDTAEMPMEVTRSFVENKDGTFSRYVSPKVDVEHVGEAYRRAAGQIPIKPFELKTFLKIGNTAADQKEPTPFIIEWIPEILPKSRIGELRIKFEYGHQRNGHVEKRVDELHTAIEHVV